MEKRIAMIVNERVENIAAWDGTSTWEPRGYQLVDITDRPEVVLGMYYYEGDFHTDPKPE